jgi:hypothetical protein
MHKESFAQLRASGQYLLICRARGDGARRRLRLGFLNAGEHCSIRQRWRPCWLRPVAATTGSSQSVYKALWRPSREAKTKS